jgi:hypothetical protein
MPGFQKFPQDFDLMEYTAPTEINLARFTAPMGFTQFTAPTEIDLAQSAPLPISLEKLTHALPNPP